MFPFPKYNEVQNELKSENLTLINTKEKIEQPTNISPIDTTSKKTKQKFNWRSILKSQNSNLETLDENVEKGIDLIDKKVDGLNLPKNSSKCIHSFLKITKYSFVFLFALLGLIGFLGHFQNDAPKLIEKTKCLFDENCNLPDLLETQNMEINPNLLENEIPDEKTFIYPNTFEEFKAVVNKNPKNPNLFQNEFNKKQS